MLRIGSQINFDCCGRITVPKELADMLNFTKGNDLVYWIVEDGKAVIHKITQPFYGIDIEAEEIVANLRNYESKSGRTFPSKASLNSNAGNCHRQNMSASRPEGVEQ